jgi:hypothetical protein
MLTLWFYIPVDKAAKACYYNIPALSWNKTYEIKKQKFVKNILKNYVDKQNII